LAGEQVATADSRPALAYVATLLDAKKKFFKNDEARNFAEKVIDFLMPRTAFFRNETAIYRRIAADIFAVQDDHYTAI